MFVIRFPLKLTHRKPSDLDGTAKRSKIKARKSLGMRRTYRYVAMTKDEAQRRDWTFFEAIN